MSDEFARERNRRSYQRRKEGVRSWDIDLPDRATEQMIDALIYYGVLTEAEAEDPERVREELASIARQLLLWWSANWRELDHNQRLEIPFIRVRRDPPESR
jgi:hypothetical protein